MENLNKSVEKFQELIELLEKGKDREDCRAQNRWSCPELWAVQDAGRVSSFPCTARRETDDR
jgi:hypothetical protein